jgi:GDP-L-fucose synthase
MEKDSKIYVAGHRGLVGSAIVKKLQIEGFKNIITRTSAELDLRRQDVVEDFFKNERPEYVFLAAAKVGGIVANNTYKAEFIYDNLMIATNVIHAAFSVSVKKLLNLGSSCIYPKSALQPLKEEYLLTGPLEPTNEPYAVAKIAAIKLCRYYNEQYRTDFISAMPTNLYGPNDNYNLETSHLVPALVRKFLLAKALHDGNTEFLKTDLERYPLGFNLDAALQPDNMVSIQNALLKTGITGKTVSLWGTGTPYREFLHVDDAADACIFLMKNCSSAETGECINIGTGVDLPIREIAEIIRLETGFQGRIHWDSTKPDGTPRKLQDISKLKNLGWKPTVSFHEGIHRTVAEYST